MTCLSRLRSRDGAVFVVSLAFLVGLLALAAMVAQVTGSDRIASINLVNAAQVDLSTGAAVEDAVAWLDAQSGVAEGSMAATLTARSAASAPGPRSGVIGRSCFDWWVEAYNPSTRSTVIHGRSYSPGLITGAGCVKDSEQISGGAEYISTARRQTDNTFRITSRRVVRLS
ncbi:hypothetical protein [Miltoncostaea oceani]|uniref:hypothetical protein n=1 Tax=Miltoncostaea oceani TaxID=2843216 RepID=UPI001C3D5C23|nr:hypothetical protein [Miltoncostaea oceani]